MTRLTWSVGVASLLLAAPSFAGTTVKHKAGTDAQINDRIEHRLARSASLRDDHITVHVKNRVATLSGYVDSSAEKRHAEQLARAAGARRVDDDLAVSTRGTSGKFDRAKDDAGKATDAAKDGVRKTGEVIDDGWITSKVKTQFIGEDLLKHSDINVDTANHVVTLNGTVPSQAARAKAVEIARSTDGVHRVVDRLVIGTHK